MYKFCLSHSHFKHIDSTGYIPVGLGDNKFPNSWLRDNTGQNISDKNKYYDMYSFHYWLWKNYLDNFNDKTWIVFSTYRRFWKTEKQFFENESIKNKIIQSPPKSWEDYDTILTEPTDMRKIKLSKLLKKGKKLIFKNPMILFDKNLRNIKFHFDLMHYEGNLDRALKLVDSKERDEFTNFLNNSYQFNPWNLFCCKSKYLLEKWYESVFTWLNKCEKEFGFENLKGYETGRIYAYLAERYLPYWFKKYSKTTTWPIYFYDKYY